MPVSVVVIYVRIASYTLLCSTSYISSEQLWMNSSVYFFVLLVTLGQECGDLVVTTTWTQIRFQPS